MKRVHRFGMLFALLMMLSTPLFPQKSEELKDLGKSFYVEFAGSSMALLSANYDFRFKKSQLDGLGMRLGFGYTPKITLLWTSVSYFTVPIEINYVFSEKPFAVEVGCALTYLRGKVEDHLFGEDGEVEDGLLSYVPVGLRYRPKSSNLMLKLNAGPRIDYLEYFNDVELNVFGGFAIGYSFSR